MQLQFTHFKRRRVHVPHQVADESAVIADASGSRSIRNTCGLHHGPVTAYVIDHPDKPVIQDFERMPENGVHLRNGQSVQFLRCLLALFSDNNGIRRFGTGYVFRHNTVPYAKNTVRTGLAVIPLGPCLQHAMSAVLRRRGGRLQFDAGRSCGDPPAGLLIERVRGFHLQVGGVGEHLALVEAIRGQGDGFILVEPYYDPIELVSRDRLVELLARIDAFAPDINEARAICGRITCQHYSRILDGRARSSSFAWANAARWPTTQGQADDRRARRF